MIGMKHITVFYLAILWDLKLNPYFMNSLETGLVEFATPWPRTSLHTV